MVRSRAWTAIGAVLLGGFAVLAQPPAEPGGPAVVVDSAGKEAKLTGVRVTAGTRRLAWQADPGGESKQGPLALQIREPHSTTFARGVLTLVPVANIEAIKYDYEKKAATVQVKGVADPVIGTLEYRGINTVGLEGDADGTATKLSGGVPKDGFKSVAFPDAKPFPARSGVKLVWSVQIAQPKANNPWLTVRNLKPLYAFPGGAELLLDTVPVRKGDPVSLAVAGVKRVEAVAVDLDTNVVVWEVQTEDGKERLVAIPPTCEQDGKTGTLVGLLGEVDAGWKLFPLAVIKAIKFEGKKLPID